MKVINILTHQQQYQSHNLKSKPNCSSNCNKMCKLTYLLIALSTMLISSINGQTGTENYLNYLLNGYDKSLPPLLNATTNVSYRYDLNSFQQVDDISSEFTVVEEIYMIWNDPRLAYRNDARFSKNVKETYMDLTSYINEFWTPKIKFNNQKLKDVIIKDYYLYADGTMIVYEKAQTTYTCGFDFSLFPNDYQSCNITVNIVYYDSKEVSLIPSQKKYNPKYFLPGARNVSQDIIENYSDGLSWKTRMVTLVPSTRYSNTDLVMASSLIMMFTLDRNPYSYAVYFILSSCIFVLMSYCTFWISKFAITARVFLAINTVLITIQANGYVYEYLPPTDYTSWLEEFCRGVMIFTCVTMLECVILNFCTTQYIMRRDNINSIVTEIRKNLSKVKKKFLKQQQAKKVSNMLQNLILQNKALQDKQEQMNLEKEQIEENLKKRMLQIIPKQVNSKDGSRQNSQVKMSKANTFNGGTVNATHNLNPNNGDHVPTQGSITNLNTQNSQIMGTKGNVLTQSQDDESDRIDDHFSIEEEKSNLSRQISFFTSKKMEIEKKKNTPQKIEVTQLDGDDLEKSNPKVQNNKFINPFGKQSTQTSANNNQLLEYQNTGSGEKDSHKKSGRFFQNSVSNQSDWTDEIDPENLHEVAWGIENDEKNQDLKPNQDDSEVESNHLHNGRFSSSSDDSFEEQEQEEQLKEEIELAVKETKQEEQRIKEEIEQGLYQKRLSHHINELEEAQNDSNPAKFQMAFDSFKGFVVDHWTQIDYDLDSRTRKQIVEVFEIENSFEFKFYKYISNNLDYLFRYGYESAFLFFLCNFLSRLYSLLWLEIVSVILFVLSIVGWILFHIIVRMKKNRLTFFKATMFYLKCYQIIPKEKPLKSNDDTENVKKKK
eukprot:403364894